MGSERQAVIRFGFGTLVWAAVGFMACSRGEQSAWFADGYHGGIYGHYPPSFSQFMVDELRQHPDWRLNLEIEPETWDFARTNTPEAYQALKALITDPASPRRVEFVNPAYGQSYLWNISGESVIQQFERGLRKIREHFPQTEVTTYCTEEPCFTSALPGILRSFGFKYAVLKNPNTCWGGYTRGHGGELVNWIGPDGVGILAVPRYQVEALKTGSTWETMAAFNLPAYIQAAREAGIAHPVGMCLQDAGWRFGPWLTHAPGAYSPTEYVTWNHYFETVAVPRVAPDWRVTQEDFQVSLVWGAQVLQRIAQQVRGAENRLAQAEKLATLAWVYGHTPWPEAALDEAWRTLLLAQHHDCWIVPYNGPPGDTWADKVRRWTGTTRQISDEIIDRSTGSAPSGAGEGESSAVRVFNTLALARTGLVSVALPAAWRGSAATVWDSAGRQLPSQMVGGSGQGEVLFAASAPAMGYRTFWLKETFAAPIKGAAAVTRPDGRVRVETDCYQAELDPNKGGTFSSLVAKRLGNQELVDTANARCFNEIRGYFFKDQRYYSSAEGAAKVEIVESGPIRVRLRISSQIASDAITQWLTLAQGEPRIDLSLTIDWQGHPGIGAEYRQRGGYRAEDDRKAFYDERYKLLALFPLALRRQQVFKDAPFDVTESRLTNTFFETWSEIKNNVLLHWVDVYDPTEGTGVALLADHTTSYAHSAEHPLGLTLQYSGVGLWGRDYSVRGPTEVNYALLPHRGNWETAGLWTAGAAWNEPLIARLAPVSADSGASERTLLNIAHADWEVPAVRMSAGKILARLFNPSAEDRAKTVSCPAGALKIELVQLNGKALEELPLRKDTNGFSVFELALPSRGIGTLRITPAQ
ncbi:Glycosyl hydrolase 38 domain protein [Verrucomicrobia bacterium]|nr:Glycosyl hydrolase 38 domain protein [Verrucomicrobiota bacterium]